MYFSNILAQKGYRIDVVTIKLPYENKIFRFHKNITIFRLFPGHLQNLLNKIRARVGSEEKKGSPIRQKHIFKILKRGYWFVMNNTLMGDLRTEWMPFCLSFLRKINIAKYSTVISSQEPFVDSLIALKLKESYPNISWIADMGDTVLSPHRPRLKQKIDMRYEKKIMEKADKIILTNKNVLEYVSTKYDIEKSKFKIIRQGFDFTKNIENKKHKNNVFTLFFTGTFYKDFREPGELIKALSGLNIDMKFIIAGKNEIFADEFSIVKDKIEFLGFIPYFESLKLQKKVDVLVNIGNKQNYQVPGKFFEYLGSKKPILNIVYNEQDETAKLVKNLNVGLVCKNNPNDIKNAIQLLHRLWSEEKMESYFDFEEKNLYKYSWQYGADTLDEILRFLKNC